MDKKTEAAEAYIEARDFPLTAAIARSAFDAGWEAANEHLMGVLFEFYGEQTNTAPAIEFPDVIRTAADVALPWPDGTRVVDNHNDRWEKRRGVWTIVGWSWQDTDELHYDDYPLDKYLPANVQKEGN